MANEQGQTTSAWMATATVPAFRPLRANRKVDVCVIGAGIAGLSCAYELLSRGVKKVVVIDGGAIGGGESGRTTGHLSFALDEGFEAIEKVHGAEGARRAAASHRLAVDRIETIARKERIACDFARVSGFLFADRDQDASRLDRELDAAHRAGLDTVRWASRSPVAAVPPERCLVYPDQGQFHVLKYLAGLARAIQREGGSIYGQTRAASVEGGAPARVKTESGRTIEAKSIVVATNSPISDWMVLHTKIYAYRTYAVAFHMADVRPLEGLYWDIAEPYHYVRTQRAPAREGQSATAGWLIVGGEDHKVGQEVEPSHRFDRLKSWARARWPMAGAVEYLWSGQIIEPVDGLAYIGRDPAGLENVYVVTGDSGHGLTHGAIAGELLTGLIVDGEHPWASLYEPSRKSLRTGGTFLAENLNVARQLADWVTAGDVGSPEEIAPGCGAVVREGLHKVAIYRGADGSYVRRSAVCPHLGCIVRWNDVEKSWDCPCHGSRFGPEGAILNGPTTRALAEAE